MEVGGEERRFVPASPGPDFDDRVTVIVRIARCQESVELSLESLDFAGEALHFIQGQLS